MTAIRALAAACAAAIASAPAAAADLATVFGTRQSVQQISLSPDGNRLAYIAPKGNRGTALYVADLKAGTSKGIAALDGNPQRLQRCDWVSNERLACSIYAIIEGNQLLPVSRLIAIDADGQNVKTLSQHESLNNAYSSLYGGSIIDFNPGKEGSILMDRWFVPETQFNTRLARKLEGYGVVEIDTRTLADKIVENPIREGVEYLTDGHGQVRIQGTQPAVGGVVGETIRYAFRKPGSRSWQMLGQYNVLTHEGLAPLSVDPGLNAVYALEKLDGRQALYRITLDDGMRRELVLSNPQVDIDDVVRIGRSRRPVGATYATERRHAVYFDPVLKQLADDLARSIPKLPLIDFVDSSADESRLLLWASSDVDPGRLFVFDKAKRELAEVMVVRPQLEGVKRAHVQAVTYRAADGATVPAYLTLPADGPQTGLPAIVMPHGGPSARDEWGFDWLAQFYAASGYAVIQPNFRGSSGYGDDWFERNGFQSWPTAISDVADAGRWLVSQGIADPRKLAIVGWSYGGYAALQAAATQPNLFKAVVAIAPVTDLEMLKEEFRGWTSHSLATKFIGQGAHVREGSPTQNAGRIAAPVILFHGTHDRNVDVNQSKRMAARLKSAGKQVELVTYDDLDHSLPDSAARADLLRKSDQFLKSAFARSGQ